MNIPDHEAYSGDARLLPEMPTFGVRRFHRAAPGGPRPHDPYAACEIAYIAEGGLEWWDGKGVLHEVGAGGVFWNPPGEWHGGAGVILHPGTVYWAQFYLDASGLPGLSADDNARIRADFSALQRRTFPASAAVGGCFEALLTAHRLRDRYAGVRARAALHTLIVTVLDDHARYLSASVGAASPRLAAVLRWIDAHLAEDHPVEALAQAAGLSVGYFHRWFAREMACTPAEYRARRRIHQAKYSLRSADRPITEIALEAGFSSGQYFATQFKAHTGLTPSEYRALLVR